MPMGAPLPCMGAQRSHGWEHPLPSMGAPPPMHGSDAPMHGWEHPSHAWEHPLPCMGAMLPCMGALLPCMGAPPPMGMGAMLPSWEHSVPYSWEQRSTLMGAPLPCMGAVLPCTWERRSHGMGAGSGAPRSHAWEGATAPISAPMSTELSAIRPCRWPCRISSPRAPRVSSRTEVNTRSVLAWEVKKSGKANTDAVTVLPCTSAILLPCSHADQLRK